VTVVPDSGTGELKGLSGHMDIQIVEGKHFYELDFELGAPESPGESPAESPGDTAA
jgi:hypothetical protein